MTREEAKEVFLNRGIIDGIYNGDKWREACIVISKWLEQEPCEDVISRKSIKQKLQEHHDFFVNAYGGFSNLPQNDKSRVDEIANCIAMVVNEPPITSQEPFKPMVEIDLDYVIKQKYIEREVLDKIRGQIKDYLRGVEITLEVLVENDPLRPKMEGAKDTLEECLELIDKAKTEDKDGKSS